LQYAKPLQILDIFLLIILLMSKEKYKSKKYTTAYADHVSRTLIKGILVILPLLYSLMVIFTPIFWTLRFYPSFSKMKLPSAPLCNAVRWWALKKIKEIGERLNTMGLDQTTLLILSIQPGTRTHLPPLLVSSPLSHPRNLVKVPATKSRSAGRPVQLWLQRKEAQREEARPQLLGRRGLHQPWRQPRASSSSSLNTGRGAHARIFLPCSFLRHCLTRET
jgi:hypothetical protein